MKISVRGSFYSDPPDLLERWRRREVQIDPLLDGQPIANVVAADEEEGWVDVLFIPRSGRERDFRVERKKGAVRLIIVPLEREEADGDSGTVVARPEAGGEAPRAGDKG